jgi:histidinol-phosphate aminotransferase
MKWLSGRLEHLSGLDYYVKPDDNVGEYVRLDSNENLMLNRQFALQIIAKAIKDVDLRFYPKQDCEDSLYRLLKNYLGIDENYLAVGSGSDQIIDLLLSIIGPGKRVALLTPTFSYFLTRCELHGLRLEKVPLRRENNTICETDFFSVAKESEIVYICSPNNPTGNQFDRKLVTEMIASLQNKLFLIDEAYVEFADYSLVSLATKYENIVVFRTLSKAFGLAGARVGYMVANENLTRIFRSRIQLPYSLGTLSLRIASLALVRSNHVRKAIERVKREREKIFENLSRINGVKVFKSDSNFLYLECCKSYYQNIVEHLHRARISVRLLGNIDGRPGCMRVTVGTREMNDRFLKAIEMACDHNKI